MEHPRTTSARDHDDSAIIDAASEGPSFAGRAGGTMAADIATRDELDRVNDPEGRTRVTKTHAIEHDQEVRPDRPRAADAGASEEVDDQPNNTVG